MSDDLIKLLRGWHITEMHEAADRIEELLEERERVIKASNDMFCVMSDSLNTAHAKLTKAVEALRLADKVNLMPPIVAKTIHAVLAELEGEPLGAEFESVWDANKGELYRE